MRCPKCKANSQVLESLKRKTEVIRKRRCKRDSCQHRWKTVERFYHEDKKKPVTKRYSEKTDKYHDDRLWEPLGDRDRSEARSIVRELGTFIDKKI